MSTADLEVREQYVSTADGWSLRMRRTTSPRHFDPSTKPLLIVPGYGMNSFIFSYHPRGTSMERCLAEAGFEVWAMDLRAQGPSKPLHSAPGAPSIVNYATIDVPTAIAHVLENTKAIPSRVTLVGCSLGGSIAYAYMALRPDERVAGLIAMGAPLRWAEIHPAVRLVFSSPALVGAVRISNTRLLMRRFVPLLLRAPVLLSFYMNTSTIDMNCIQELTQTVEDPHPAINKDIAIWLKRGDLEFEGVNITEALGEQRKPLMLVLSNKDGIVPERTAMTAATAWGGDDIEVLRVGDDDNWYAHANLFVADDAPRLVFEPIIRWLRQTEH